MKACKKCGKPVVLRPSAAERAAKDCTGKTAAYYESLFPWCEKCDPRCEPCTDPRKLVAEAIEEAACDKTWHS